MICIISDCRKSLNMNVHMMFLLNVVIVSSWVLIYLSLSSHESEVPNQKVAVQILDLASCWLCTAEYDSMPPKIFRNDR